MFLFLVWNSVQWQYAVLVWMSRFPARRESRPEDEPPQAERLIPRAAAPMHFPAVGNPLLGEAFSVERRCVPHDVALLGTDDLS